MSAGRMVKSFREYVLAEPVYFFMFFANDIAFFAIPNLYLQKACRDDRSSAPDLNTPCDDDRRGSDYVASVYNSFLFPGMMISLIFILFASQYSDATKNRRLFIVVALIGQQMKILVSIAQTIFWSWSPLTGTIVTCIVENAFGGPQCVITFTFAYIFDKTSKESRLFRLTLMSVVQATGTLLGRGSAGFLLRRFGFLVTFVVSFVLYTLALVSAIFFVRKESVAVEQRVNLKHVYGVKQIWRTFALIVLPPQKSRKHLVAIWLLLLVHFVAYFSFLGEMFIIYLYFRNQFHWGEEKFSLFSCYRTLSATLGGLLCTFVMSKWLRIHDGIVGLFAAFWDTCAALAFYYAREEWQIYSAPVFDVFHVLALSTSFSQLSKFFTEREFGRMNCIAMIFLSMGVGGVPVYSALYTNTSDTNPSAIFLLSAFLSILIGVLYRLQAIGFACMMNALQYVKHDTHYVNAGRGQCTSLRTVRNDKSSFISADEIQITEEAEVQYAVGGRATENRYEPQDNRTTVVEYSRSIVS